MDDMINKRFSTIVSIRPVLQKDLKYLKSMPSIGLQFWHSLIHKYTHFPIGSQGAIKTNSTFSG